MLAQKAGNFPPPAPALPPTHHPPGLISGFSGGKKKSQNKNFDDHIITIYLALTSTSSVLTMEMFSLLDEFWATSEPKSGGAS
jgi:hypothetical protein